MLVCELVSRPFANMGICDDGPYILVAQNLATTGHLVYNGWMEAMLGWQLYLGAAFIKLFGFSYTTVRMSTVLVAVVLAFFLQRTMVRANISERNATIGTLALVLSPLYLMLSATFMTDIHGLLAIVVCLYGCVRAVQAATTRATIGWLCFAVVTNAACGTSRQIAWLGVLVMVPSTLWLLRAQRRVVLAGTAATFAGALFIFGCMRWFQQQPYSLHAHLVGGTFSAPRTLSQLTNLFLEVLFLILPIVALFLPEVRKLGLRVIAIISAVSLIYIRLAIHRTYLPLLEPTMGRGGDWIGVHGVLEIFVKGAPIFLHVGVQVLLTMVTYGGLLGLVVSAFRSRGIPPVASLSPGVSWRQLGVLLGPFVMVYTLILILRSATTPLYDRYALPLLLVALICGIRYYQERIRARLPLVSIFLIGIVAIYGVAVTHNMFALYRARVAIAAEIRAAGIPDTSVDGGWEYNLGVELQHAQYINNYEIAVPAHAYVPTPPLPAGSCQMPYFEDTPHIRPLYGVSFDPNECYGPAAFAPVTYSRWLASTPGSLFVVRYTSPVTH